MAGIDGCGSGYQPPVTDTASSSTPTSTGGSTTSGDNEVAKTESHVAQSFFDFISQNATKFGKADKAYTQMVFNYDIAKKNMDELARIGKQDS